MRTFSECQKIVNAVFNKLQLPEVPRSLYEPIRYVLAMGGKRLRPTLVIMACNMFSEDIEATVYPALALEVFHNFTLVHDDIMDESAVRRGKETVHVKWNRNVGILAGDAMVIKSYELLAKTDPQYMQSMVSIFSQTALNVCEGQQYDMDFEQLQVISMQEYLKMIELKTAVLIAASLKMGAITGGASQNNAQLLYDFGRHIGLAFQIRDDYLDLYADPLKFGKSLGNDVVANKKTMLMVHAIQSAKGKDKEVLFEWLEKKEFDRQEKIHTIRNLYNKLGTPEYIRQQIKHHHTEGLQFLENIPVNAERKSELKKVADMLLDRTQ